MRARACMTARVCNRLSICLPVCVREYVCVRKPASVRACECISASLSAFSGDVRTPTDAHRAAIGDMSVAALLDGIHLRSSTRCIPPPSPPHPDPSRPIHGHSV